MEQLFLKILDMSITSSYVILFIIIIRFLLKKIPKIFSYALWSVVLFRLICPFSFESIVSLIPANKPQIAPDIIYPPSILGNYSPTIMPETNLSGLPQITNSGAEPIQIFLSIVSIVWVIGFLSLLIYAIISVIRLKYSLRDATLYSNNIYKKESLKTPFVLGIIKPKIYLPTGLSKDENEYILKHEQTHIKRFDYLIKPISFLVLSLHWFNPLVWLAFWLMSRDMEMSCDESVIKQMGSEIKKPYSASLLSISIKRSIINATPLAFGESNTKSRIKNVLNYKKPVFWVTILAIITVIAVCIGLVSNPINDNSGSSFPISGNTVSGDDLDLSFLNPDNLISVVSEQTSIKVAVLNENAFCSLTAKSIMKWISDTTWTIKDIPVPYDLEPTYILQNLHSEDVVSEIRLSKNDKTLAMVVYDDTYRYYTIDDEAFDKIQFLIIASSNRQPFYAEPVTEETAVAMLQKRYPQAVKFVLDGEKTLGENGGHQCYSYSIYAPNDSSNTTNKLLAIIAVCKKDGMMFDYEKGTDTWIPYGFGKYKLNGLKPFYIMTADDNAPIGCEFSRASANDNMDTLQMLEQLEGMNGFIFNKDYVAHQYIEFQFHDEKPKDIYLRYISEDEWQTEYPIDSANYKIKVPTQVGRYSFFADITWSDETKETAYFSITVTDKIPV